MIVVTTIVSINITVNCTTILTNVHHSPPSVDGASGQSFKASQLSKNRLAVDPCALPRETIYSVQDVGKVLFDAGYLYQQTPEPVYPQHKKV